MQVSPFHWYSGDLILVRGNGVLSAKIIAHTVMCGITFPLIIPIAGLISGVKMALAVFQIILAISVSQ